MCNKLETVEVGPLLTNVEEHAYRPYLEYSSSVWDPHTKSQINRIEKVQRRAATFVTNCFHDSSSVTDMITNLNWPLLETRTRASLIMFNKIVHHIVAIHPDPSLLIPNSSRTRQEKEMESRNDSQPFNFPYQCNGITKNREVFTNYGPSCFIDIKKDGVIVNQRSKGDNCDRFSAIHPVLPLSCSAEKVKLPLKDRVMGDVIEKNKTLKSFQRRVQKFYSCGKRWGKMEQVECVSSGVEHFKAGCEAEELPPDVLDELYDQIVGVNTTQWFRSILKDYTQLKGSIGLQFNNVKYAGGCLDSICMDSTHCYIASAAGNKFNQLRLTFVSQKTEGLLQSYSADEVKLVDSIYGVKTRRVQGEDFISVKTDKNCYLYKVTPGTQDRKLHLVNKSQEMCFQAVDISPYIPGECVLSDEAGQCYLWQGERFEDIAVQGEPRFQVSDRWCHVQYGSHPRQLLYADQTAVELFDLRMPNLEGHDLFSLPSKLLHNSERIRACSRHPASTFYHLVATDYKLLLMDERYSKYPVLKWEHMLSTPPQYISSVDGTSCNPDSNFIYIASQYPADVHAFRFSLRNSLPPIAISQAHRAAKITDISKWPFFVDKCPNTDVLYSRLDTSIAGISTSPWQQGHAVFQLDSQGEIFHQVFLANQSSSSDTTFSAGPGSYDLLTLPVAVERAQTWIDSWTELMKAQLSSCIKTRDVQPALQGMFYYRPPNELCSICHPDLGYMPGEIEVTNPTSYCETCLVLLKDGQNILDSVHKDRILPSTSEHQPQGLKEAKNLPTNTALSKLLVKQWFGEKDSQHFDDILKEWDKEVLEKRKARKTTDKKDLPDMSEESVMQRILQKESRPAGSSPTHTNTSAVFESWEPSLASSTGSSHFSPKKRPHRSEKSLTNVTSQHKSEGSVISSRKRRRKEREVGSSEISAGTESMKSVVLGSTDSSMSETFKINAQNKSGDTTVLPMFRSLLTGSQEHASPTTRTKKPEFQQASQSLSKSQKPDQTQHTNKQGSLFLTPVAPPKTSLKKAPSSSSEKTQKKKGKTNSPALSMSSVGMVSEFSENTGSEDLFNSSLNTMELANEDKDDLSSVLSVANCKGLVNSQVLTTLSPSQNLGDDTISQVVCSPRKGGVHTSPRKAVKRKAVAGF